MLELKTHRLLNADDVEGVIDVSVVVGHGKWLPLELKELTAVVIKQRDYTTFAILSNFFRD